MITPWKTTKIPIAMMEPLTWMALATKPMTDRTTKLIKEGVMYLSHDTVPWVLWSNRIDDGIAIEHHTVRPGSGRSTRDCLCHSAGSSNPEGPPRAANAAK